LAATYVKALNCIHYMHDKYAYERIEMALHDRDILRTMACGIAGLSVAADSLSAIATPAYTSSATKTAWRWTTASRATIRPMAQRRPGGQHGSVADRNLHEQDQGPAVFLP
jgi:hypothetical protein